MKTPKPLGTIVRRGAGKGYVMSGYLPDTQEDCDRAANPDEGYYCDWCEERVDDEHECPACDPSVGIDESEECPHGVLYCEPCTSCFPPRFDGENS